MTGNRKIQKLLAIPENFAGPDFSSNDYRNELPDFVKINQSIKYSALQRNP
jgi:hypothetical protein